MKKTRIQFFIPLAMALMLCFALNGNRPNQQRSNSETDKMNQKSGDLLFHPGMITVKFVEGLENYTKQTGLVNFNQVSLDQLAETFEVNLLEKRFKYNPTKLKQGMPDLSRIYRIEFPGMHSVPEVVKAFDKNPLVEYAEAIPVYTFFDIPDDILYEQCQHLPQIMAEEAWDIHHGEEGEEVIVGIIDTGTDWKHPDLAENTWQNLGEDADGDGFTMEYDGSEWIRDPDDLNGIDDDNNGYVDDVIGWDFHQEALINNGSNPDPIWYQGPYTHGTHCSGIATAVTDNEIGISSISWNLKYMPVQTDNGFNTVTYGFDGIIYAAENGADIITNSWGGFSYSQAHEEVINYAQQLGSIILAAAGNGNINEMLYPASYPGVISVGSVNGDDTRAEYSSYGPAVDISAPGGGSEGGILSTVPENGYDLSSGTSMASPLVAGCFALLKSYHPEWTNDQLIMQVLGTADDINSLNPDYLGMLGTGRVNAFHMLSDENVSMLQEFKLVLTDAHQEDENGNDINEQGEEVVMNFEIMNFVPYVTEDNVIVELQCNDPEIEILDGIATVNIPTEGIFTIVDQFLIKVGADAHSHFVDFTLHFQSNTSIVYGQGMNFKLLISPSGIFVFDGEYDKKDYSGGFINSFLNRLGYEVTYSDIYPATLRGFDAVFTSYGNRGATWSSGTKITEENSLIFQDYLENGGFLYVEKDRMFTRIFNQGYSNYIPLRELFGVLGHYSPNSVNIIDSLVGSESTPFEGISFTKSHQLNNWRMEKPTALTGAAISFTEVGYGNVAIMNHGAGTYGQKTFYFTYSLAELVDKSAASSRYNVLLKIMEFFEYDLPEAYVLSNFTSDKTIGSPPLNVQFSDISLSDTGFQVNEWQWDFDSDGIIDSYDQNPQWTYTEGGSYDVSLIVSNGENSDTLVTEGYIQTNHGVFVFEGIAGAPCYSGTFISDYLSANAYAYSSQTSFPPSFDGYDAIFLSFGNFGLNYTEVTDEMAAIIMQYIQNGGFAYLEGADVMGFDQASNSALQHAFGLSSAGDGVTNEIDHLEGQAEALTEGILFTSSSQPENQFIDTYSPLPGAHDAFIESDYGTVAVQFTGNYDQRTFCFSYALAELDDTSFPNTREELLQRILNFFDITTKVKSQEIVPAMDLKVYPNPCSDFAKLQVVISERQIVTCNLYDINGTKLKEIMNEKTMAGTCELEIDLTAMPPGVYFCILSTQTGTYCKKLIRL